MKHYDIILKKYGIYTYIKYGKSTPAHVLHFLETLNREININNS